MLSSMWHLNSQTRDRTCALCSGSTGLNYWTSKREVPSLLLLRLNWLDQAGQGYLGSSLLLQAIMVQTLRTSHILENKPGGWFDWVIGSLQPLQVDTSHWPPGHSTPLRIFSYFLLCLKAIISQLISETGLSANNILADPRSSSRTGRTHTLGGCGTFHGTEPSLLKHSVITTGCKSSLTRRCSYSG